MHTPLLVVVASVSPWPGVHVETDTDAQPAPFVPALKFVPATQLVHTPSLVVVAGVSPLPDVHDVILCVRHAPVLSNALNVPALQTVHLESVDDVPAANPKPAAHLVFVFTFNGIRLHEFEGCIKGWIIVELRVDRTGR